MTNARLRLRLLWASMEYAYFLQLQSSLRRPSGEVAFRRLFSDHRECVGAVIKSLFFHLPERERKGPKGHCNCPLQAMTGSAETNLEPTKIESKIWAASHC